MPKHASRAPRAQGTELAQALPAWVLGAARLELRVGDITHQDLDAIGNAANAELIGGGGVDGAIHRAAGPELMRALGELRRVLPGERLATGGVVLTPAFRLPARYVLHCVGPIYARAGSRAPELLASCYTRALELASEHGLRSVAFPSISTGVYGYPLAAAARVALGAVRDYWMGHEARLGAAGTSGVSGAPVAIELVRFVLFDQRSYEAYVDAGRELFGEPG